MTLRVCDRCNRERGHHARGLCKSCYIVSIRPKKPPKPRHRSRCVDCGGYIKLGSTRCLSCAGKEMMARDTVDATRVRPYIVSELTRMWGEDWERYTVGGFNVIPLFPPLAERCGVSEDLIRRLARGKVPKVSPPTLDKILCGLDRLDLWHVAPEQGGFADVYARPWRGDNKAPESGALKVA